MYTLLYYVYIIMLFYSCDLNYKDIVGMAVCHADTVILRMHHFHHFGSGKSVNSFKLLNQNARIIGGF